jgi:pimeloyl-ACP methyl ester carboxylesterase
MSRLFAALTIFILASLVVLLLGSSFLISSDLLRSDLTDKYRGEASFIYRLPSGAQAHIRDEGNRNGPPLLLIHGSNASLHTWEPWVKELGDSYRLISIDLPGHGLTGQTFEDEYTVDAMARFAKEIVELFALDKVTLAGNSMGGAVSLKFALDYPEKVKALALVSSAGMARDPNAKSVGAFNLVGNDAARELMRYVTPRFLIGNTLRGVVADPDNFVTQDMVTRHWELLRMTGSRDATIKRFTGYANAAPLEPQLSTIRTPTLILWGATDPLIPVTQGVRMAELMPNSQIKIYNNAAHLAHEEIPEETAADTRAFLENLNIK